MMSVIETFSLLFCNNYLYVLLTQSFIAIQFGSFILYTLYSQIRRLFPEYDMFVKTNPLLAGEFTRKGKNIHFMINI